MAFRQSSLVNIINGPNSTLGVQGNMGFNETAIFDFNPFDRHPIRTHGFNGNHPTPVRVKTVN